MKSFLSRFHALVLFTLSGFDRIRLCGESRLLNHARGVQSYCYQRRVLFKDFPQHAQALTDTLCSETKQQLGNVPKIHLNSPDIDKEAIALDHARQQGRTSGRIAVITCQESGLTYRLRKNDRGLIEPRKEKTRCNHYYHYFLHEQLGLCYVRIQSWFPFSVRVGLNGRRWLAQQLRNRNVGFEQRGNLITSVADVELAKQLLDEQKYVLWPEVLAELVRPVHPLWDYLHDQARTPFYWMAEQTEWATDFVFRSADDLALWYPRWIQHGILNLSCKDVMRYLGKKVPEHGYGPLTGEAKIDLRTRAEGTRLKFWYNTNASKIYDKEGIALRVETTINSTKEYKVFRTKEGEPADAPKSWQHLRKGVADMSRRAEVADAANGRLIESLASVAEPKTLGELLKPLGQPVVKDGRRLARPLNPLTGADGELLRTIAQGDYLLNGFRNRDLRWSLMGHCADDKKRRQQSARITRLLALLKAHGLIWKVPKTHRYQLTAQGRRIVTALLSAHSANVQELSAA
jgi:protein required for attachment to host cells